MKTTRTPNGSDIKKYRALRSGAAAFTAQSEAMDLLDRPRAASNRRKWAKQVTIAADGMIRIFGPMSE